MFAIRVGIRKYFQSKNEMSENNEKLSHPCLKKGIFISDNFNSGNWRQCVICVTPSNIKVQLFKFN
jgi:hypothetical protein